jgi:hypothetical protein
MSPISEEYISAIPSDGYGRCRCGGLTFRDVCESLELTKRDYTQCVKCGVFWKVNETHLIEHINDLSIVEYLSKFILAHNRTYQPQSRPISVLDMVIE